MKILSILGLIFFATIGAQANSHSCQWFRDSTEIVHLKAESRLDAFFCWGFAHAQDRIWQMDYHRRLVQGRTAELHGYKKLKQDIMLRLLKLDEQSKRMATELDEKTLQELKAYSAGVNQYLSGRDLKKEHYEFRELGYSPEPWEVHHSLGLVLLQALDQTRQTFLGEIQEEEWLKIHGEGRIHDFLDYGTPWFTSILKSDEYQKRLTATASKAKDKTISKSRLEAAAARELNSWFPDWNVSTGSNNWVIAGKKGSPALLANDPHLGLKHPPFWHYAEVQAPDFQVLGATFPGIPLVVSGVNGHMAWGLTNSYYDVGRLGLVRQTEVPILKTERPTVYIRFGFLKIPFFFKKLEWTTEGLPILPLETPEGFKMVLNWTGHLVRGSDFADVFKIMDSQSGAEFQNRMKQGRVPSWNFVFADKKNHIGLQVSGRLLKNNTTTPFGLDEIGLQSLKDLSTTAPEENPALLDPKRGWITTANNAHFPLDSKLHGGFAYRSSFRAFRIEELLKAGPTETLEDLAKIQCDLQSVEARFLRPEILNLIRGTGTKEAEVLEALKQIEEWNLDTSLDCKVCGLYRRLSDRLQERWHLNVAALYRRLQRRNPAHAQEALEEFRAAIADLKKVSGSANVAWGNLHRNYFRHASDDSRFFKDRSLATPADENVVSPGTSDWTSEGYQHKAGASHRLLVELNEKPRILMQLAGSNQNHENPSLDAENSPWKRWSECKYHEVSFPTDWAAVSSSQKLEFELNL